MADKQPETDPVPTPEPEPDPEAVFWGKFDTHMEAWYEKKFGAKPPDDKPKPDAPPAPGTSRTGGKRVTLGSLFADAVFGPEKS